MVTISSPLIINGHLQVAINKLRARPLTQRGNTTCLTCLFAALCHGLGTAFCRQLILMPFMV
ncbi:hypothetical protein BO82DRAFT_352458 [Aspergillus uvarum CBS 121591]|uniref:Uncharacterized protein n=1 Tax=Aspergillus uvarum CBS 121591 TaxID=1448315 RepID=A0A319CLV2_9EURO|nr:hypothetical protein BO82DRAFT_352458 [Aspergillus uvarum CBS 121591]PYH84067.1 hypothetical protein BO82DRAFT_352458 [Aspergillus uvarum CBS 121591]